MTCTQQQLDIKINLLRPGYVVVKTMVFGVTLFSLSATGDLMGLLFPVSATMCTTEKVLGRPRPAPPRPRAVPPRWSPVCWARARPLSSVLSRPRSRRHVMKLLALLVLGIASAAAAAAIEEEESAGRDKRVFSLFSIVQFPNEECVTTDINVKAGVCTTSSECTAGAGTASGKCASGFGGEQVVYCLSFVLSIN